MPTLQHVDLRTDPAARPFVKDETVHVDFATTPGELMSEAFSMARSEAGDVLHGKAGDWVLQYAPGDYGVVQAQRFAKVYRPA